LKAIHGTGARHEVMLPSQGKATWHKRSAEQNRTHDAEPPRCRRQLTRTPSDKPKYCYKGWEC